jgi:hypothetical protein
LCNACGCAARFKLWFLYANVAFEKLLSVLPAAHEHVLATF